MKKRILPGILIACAAFSACAFEITENTAVIGEVRAAFDGADEITFEEIDVSGSEKLSRE